VEARLWKEARELVRRASTSCGGSKPASVTASRA
jgi:hypothetical protein